MARRGAIVLGLVVGVACGWALGARHVRQHRQDLFSPRPLCRHAALTGLDARGGGVETVRLLRDYLEWERVPMLRRRAMAIVRRLEAALV